MYETGFEKIIQEGGSGGIVVATKGGAPTAIEIHVVNEKYI